MIYVVSMPMLMSYHRYKPPNPLQTFTVDVVLPFLGSKLVEMPKVSEPEFSSLSPSPRPNKEWGQKRALKRRKISKKTRNKHIKYRNRKNSIPNLKERNVNSLLLRTAAAAAVVCCSQRFYF